MFYSLRSPSEMEMLSGAGASMRPLTLSPEKAQDLVPKSAAYRTRTGRHT